MYYEDAKELERKLDFFSRGNDEQTNITRIEAQFIAKCINFALREGTGIIS